MTPEQSYFRIMELIRRRFLLSEVVVSGESTLSRAERIALQVRKIVEGVAFAALSGIEARNRASLVDHRSKDADKLLLWMERKNLLRLPSAQRIGAAVQGYAAVFEGGAGAAAGFDLDVATLQEMFSRASNLIHERHPERLEADQVARELSVLEQDVKRLKDWLWLHIMFLRGSGFLVQMGKYGTASFMIALEKQDSV